MEIIDQFLITDPLQLMKLGIIDFHRLNGAWADSEQAIRCIFSWFDHLAVATCIVIPNYHNAPKRNDFPEWKHAGNHPEEGEEYWNWFNWNHEGGELNFSDSPDFWGNFEDGTEFWGDIGKVSASAFAGTQKQMGAHTLWISVLGYYGRDYKSSYQVLIEPLVSLRELWGKQCLPEYKSRVHQLSFNMKENHHAQR